LIHFENSRASRIEFTKTFSRSCVFEKDKEEDSKENTRAKSCEKDKEEGSKESTNAKICETDEGNYETNGNESCVEVDPNCVRIIDQFKEIVPLYKFAQS